MKILAIDTSSETATAAVTDGEILLGECVLNHKKTHSQKLMVIIERMMNDLELDAEDIDLFAVAEGPGSFTGLRIGIATAKGLAHSVNKGVVGVSTLEALAYNLPYASGLIVPIMDARNNQVFNGAYEWNGGEITTVIEPNACDIYECLDKVQGRKVIFTGDGVNVHKELIVNMMGENALFAPVNARLSHAAAVAAAARIMAERGGVLHYTELAPKYLRLSQAEKDLIKKTEGDKL